MSKESRPQIDSWSLEFTLELRVILPSNWSMEKAGLSSKERGEGGGDPPSSSFPGSYHSVRYICCKLVLGQNVTGTSALA